MSWHFWRDRQGSGALRFQRAVSVFLAAVALFPVISASDDRVRLADICTIYIPHSVAWARIQVQNTASPPLEDPEHGKTAEPLFFVARLIAFFAVEPRPAARAVRWTVRSALGRAPPLSPAPA